MKTARSSLVSVMPFVVLLMTSAMMTFPLKTSTVHAQELEAIKKGKPARIPDDPKQQQVNVTIESPHSAVYYNRGNGNRSVRFFAAKLNFINLTPEPTVVKREGIQLQVGGADKSIIDVPSRLSGHSFFNGTEQVSFKKIKPADQLSIPSGGTAATWVFFDEVSEGSDVPQMTLKIAFDDQSKEIDVNAVQKEALGLGIDRIGPRGALGLVTIHGKMNSINMGALVDEIDELVDQKVVRVVLRWAETASIPSQDIVNWLYQNAQTVTRNQRNNRQYPALSPSMREFHLCPFPKVKGKSRNVRYTDGSENSHATEADAVEAALASAFQSLPRDELLQSIESGHLLSRAAALSTGGGRLSSEHLGRLLQLAEDKEPILQQAAVAALRHFGEPAAIDKLVELIKKNLEPLSSMAIESLAESRFATAHAALLTILRNEPPVLQKKIVKVLAAHPRAIWSDAIYQFVKDPRDGLNQEALQALTQIGHPQLVDVLRDALTQGEPKIQNKAFIILSSRQDHKSEKIAVEYALEHLPDEKLDPKVLSAMHAFFERVKDNRAVPLFIARFPKSKKKQSIIKTLSLIGDPSVADFFVHQFPSLQTSDQAIVLTALNTLHSPEFHNLAMSSLLSKNHLLVRAAAQGLQKAGSAESVIILAEALEKSSHQNSWSVITRALAELGTPTARKALLLAQNSQNKQKRIYARNAIRQINRQSPAMQYVNYAQQRVQEKKFDEATELFATAILMDPQLPDAYTGRANMFLQQQKFKEAGPDFRKGWELDPWNSIPLTGLCIVMVMHEEKSSEAIELLEKKPQQI